MLLLLNRSFVGHLLFLHLLLSLVNLCLVDIIYGVLVDPVLIFVNNSNLPTERIFKPNRCAPIRVHTGLLPKQQGRKIYVNRVNFLLLGHEDRFLYGLLVPLIDEVGLVHVRVVIGLDSEDMLVIELVDQIHSLLVDELQLLFVVLH